MNTREIAVALARKLRKVKGVQSSRVTPRIALSNVPPRITMTGQPLSPEHPGQDIWHAEGICPSCDALRNNGA